MDVIDRLAIYRLHAEFCKILGDANRLLIISELSGGELSVGELTRRLGLGQANVSKHLAMMRERGLVSTRKEGATVHYSLTDSRVFEAIKLLTEAQADLIRKQHDLAAMSPDLSA